ncbi:PstS family phosphate ABC transporter substrate-binding protein [Trichocoleus sp. DQ-A3]|uniref:PstS family phosphate ABC transporter substrate-binding protein n=1 Tax=Cyanophyceae TaxID=3028117 RepID=UPI001689448A|nr:PstS family phosphate ABC transporter substrate-binding protein [Coleofasciculus sp. FACHB-125]MBD1901524.1 PstS family phosphate ABC transporter substrate-binding protein [Coleofasciculus sp. FACHB-125]
MSQKNETTVLVLALLLTAALLGAGFWWFTKRSGVDLGRLNQTTNPSDSAANDRENQPNRSTPSTGESFPQVQNVPTGLFSYGGSTSWAPIRLAVDSRMQAARPEFRLRYVEPNTGPASSGAGIRMLLDGKIDFAQSSRPILTSEYNQAQQRGFGLKEIAIAIDGLAVAVNPNLNIQGLTLEQLKSIYTGKITNWQELGGPDIPIKPYSRSPNAGGTVELFVEEVLNGQPFSANVEFVSTTTQALQKLGGSPGGIYFASAPEVVPQCSIKPLPVGRRAGEFVTPYQEPFVPLQTCPSQRNQLNIQAFQTGQYPLTRKLFVIVKQNGQREQQAGEAYANLLQIEQGQQLISEAGFVRLR